MRKNQKGREVKRSILCGLTLLLLSGCGVSNSTQEIPAAVTVESDADTDTEMYSEVEAVEEITDRQFDASSMTTEYTEDGKYTGMEFIHDDSAAKHPQYDLYYKSESGVTWTIRLIGNELPLPCGVSYGNGI